MVPATAPCRTTFALYDLTITNQSPPHARVDTVVEDWKILGDLAEEFTHLRS